MKTSLQDITRSIASLSRLQKIGFGTIAAATLSCVGWLLSLGEQSPYRAVASGLRDRAAADELAERLYAGGIPARTSTDGLSVEVPEARMSDAMGVASARGSSRTRRSRSLISDLAGKNPILLSPEERRLLGVRVMESRIEQNLTTYSMVDRACVNLSLPRSTGFASERGTAKASVILTFRPGFRASQGLLDTIRTMVSHGVDGLSPEYISVSDSSLGNLETAGREVPEEASPRQTRQPGMAAAELHEQMVAKKITCLLSRLFGESNLVVTVTAESAPRPGATGDAINGGSVNYRTVAAQTEARVSGGKKPIASIRTRTTLIPEARGPLTRLSVSVLINSRLFPKQQLPEGLKRKAEALIMAASGFDSARNDVVSVVGAPFQCELPSSSVWSFPLVSVITAGWSPWVLGGGATASLLCLLLFLHTPGRRRGEFREPSGYLPEALPSSTFSPLLGLSRDELHDLLHSESNRDLAVVLHHSCEAVKDLLAERVSPGDRELMLAQVDFVRNLPASEVQRCEQRLYRRICLTPTRLSNCESSEY